MKPKQTTNSLPDPFFPQEKLSFLSTFGSQENNKKRTTSTQRAARIRWLSSSVFFLRKCTRPKEKRTVFSVYILARRGEEGRKSHEKGKKMLNTSRISYHFYFIPEVRLETTRCCQLEYDEKYQIMSLYPTPYFVILMAPSLVNS